MKLGDRSTEVGDAVTTLTTALVLEEGESLDSERVRRQTGAFAIASLHYSYEQVQQFGRRPPGILVRHLGRLRR